MSAPQPKTPWRKRARPAAAFPGPLPAGLTSPPGADESGWKDLDVAEEHDRIVGEMLEGQRALSGAAVRLHTASARAAGLSEVECDVVNVLSRTGPLRNNDLARESDLAPATTTELVDRRTREGSRPTPTASTRPSRSHG